MASLAYPLVVPPLDPGQRPERLGERRARACSAPCGPAKFIRPSASSRAWPRPTGRTTPPNSTAPWPVTRTGSQPKFSPRSRQRPGGVLLQPDQSVPARDHHLHLRLCAGGRRAADVRRVAELSESLRRSAFYLIVLAFVVHTFGLIFRMVLEGRPPVTNLYSSAIFIGWGACVLGLVLERVYKVGLGQRGGGAGRFRHAAHRAQPRAGRRHDGNDARGARHEFLARDARGRRDARLRVHVRGRHAGDGVRRARSLHAVALDEGRHRQLGEKAGDLDLGKALAKMVYAIVCFATLFSFIGTVLGGIWADQSWGRFWGWDPKENGALLIVIWNALILHARWGGLVRERGLMNLAIFGNIVTSFSWFGVNMLGIGLHSYGFMDAAFKWLMLFVASQVCLIVLGLLPLSLWKSFQPKIPGPRKSAAA